MIAPGALIGERYQIVELLAQGGMADVFRAHDVRLTRDVALKAFRVGTADVRRFRLETQVLASFDHPNLVRVLDAGDVEQQPYLVLELVAGPTLAHRLDTGPLNEAEARRLGADLSAGLTRVHSARIVHRDVKPANILLAADGRALLGDFGIALLLDATRLTAASHVPGTVAYLAPEQVGGGPVTPGIDVYSLGLVLLEALTGQRPFEGTPQEMMAARLTRPPAIPPELPGVWPALLAEMTALDPEARPTATAVHAQLTGSHAVRTVVSGPTVVPGPTVAGPTVVSGPMVVPEPTVSGPTVSAAPTEATVVAAPTAGIGPPGPVVADSPTRRRRRTATRLALAGLAAVGALVLAGVLLRGDDPAVDAPPPNQVSTTSTPVSSTTTAPATPATTAPTTAPVRGTGCAGFEAAKQAIEAQKQQVEQQRDKALRDRLKQELEDQKKNIEQAKGRAGC